MAFNFSRFQMTEKKSVSSQVCEYQNIVNGLAKEGNVLPIEFKTRCLVEKLSDSKMSINWNKKKKREKP